MIRLLTNCLLLSLMIVLTSCKQLASSSTLPPVEVGNVALAPDDQPPVETTGKTFRLVIPKEEPESVTYSGTSD